MCMCVYVSMCMWHTCTYMSDVQFVFVCLDAHKEGDEERWK